MIRLKTVNTGELRPMVNLMFTSFIKSILQLVISSVWIKLDFFRLVESGLKPILISSSWRAEIVLTLTVVTRQLISLSMAKIFLM